ncbi:MAG: DUF1566 domain-containing protein [Gammaproteobacteria bacterium]|nr:DUF1566 domain-containing protein [Gammaproteobacteria bacterium]MDH4316364.1 DUF1566 domain-containing protein [Gammaproteobacteria bacterium]MDH5215472.1 DUF1566 domain-containing protein [Gammaproteobacteria bacterium]
MTGKTRYIVLSGVLPILLAACGKSDSPPGNPHENKYQAVTMDGGESAGCVLDTRTSLVWEVKSDEPGLRDWRNTYSWFNPNEAHRELDYRGLQNGGVCVASECDTWDYVRAVNAMELCGFNDWRVPTKDEFFSISDLSKASSPPTTNLQAFPFTQPAEYWTGNDYSFQHESAWAWNFQYGHDRVDWKKSAKYLRLVRGEARQLEAVKE